MSRATAASGTALGPVGRLDRAVKLTVALKIFSGTRNDAGSDRVFRPNDGTYGAQRVDGAPLDRIYVTEDSTAA